jgi:hypothetical protein
VGGGKFVRFGDLLHLILESRRPDQRDPLGMGPVFSKRLGRIAAPEIYELTS